MAYLIGVEQVINIVQKPPTENLAGFIGLVSFTGIFYGVFAYLREQACTLICPYGRLQGVLLDENSIVVAYDWLRGEPRGKIKKDENSEIKGDCVDCTLCVQVCPTGIDIRNGTQMECVNCTACIDACDDVMIKVNRPTGLIRFDSYNGIAEKKKLKISPRIVAYSAVLVLLMAAFTYLLLTRESIEATIMRVPGMTFQEQPDGRISNLYNVQLVNKTFDDQPVTFELKGTDGEIRIVGENELILPGQAKKETTFFILLDKEKIKTSSTRFSILVYTGDQVIDEIETRFLGPVE
jgi:cytochrome c oxidase accessory protein FixG